MTSATTRTTPQQLYRLLTVNVSARQMTTPGFVEAIVGMTRALGIGVIPEGIETDGQPERLMAMGCDHAQGFLLSRPLPADELEGLL